MAQLENLNPQWYWFHSWCNHGIEVGAIYRDSEPNEVQSWVETHGPFENFETAIKEAALVRNEEDY